MKNPQLGWGILIYSIDIKYLKDNNISYSNLPKEMKEQELEFAKKYYDKVIPNTPFKPNVAEYIDKIKALGHEIIVIVGKIYMKK